jgi:thioredoxin 1
MKIFTENNFSEEVLQNPLPVVVDFWAEWCGPCKMLIPILEEVAADFEGRVVIGKVNVDDNPVLASDFAVNSIPTLIFWRNGQVEDQVTGLIPKKVLIEKIKQIFGIE